MRNPGYAAIQLAKNRGKNEKALAMAEFMFGGVGVVASSCVRPGREVSGSFSWIRERRGMYRLAVQIVRFVDATFPGWVECELVDAAGHCHTLRDKVPIFTVDDLGPDSRYPAPGIVACEVLERYLDEKGRELARIGTIKPWGIESTEGLCEFTVLASRLDSKDD